MSNRPAASLTHVSTTVVVRPRCTGVDSARTVPCLVLRRKIRAELGSKGGLLGAAVEGSARPVYAGEGSRGICHGD